MPGEQSRKRYPLPKRFNVALSERAYANLRQLNAEHGLGNNYLITVLLENLPDLIPPERLRAAYREFIAAYGAPQPGAGMGRTRTGKDGP